MGNDSARNVFSGPSAIRDFLDPDRQPMLPLVELPDDLNPFAADGVRIYAKMMNMVPLANVKSLPALNMLRRRHESGELAGVTTLIENSSGNTVFSLGIIARIFGILRTKAIVSHEVSRGKLQLLRFFGVEISVNEEPICPDPSDVNSGIYLAKRAGTQKGWWNPGQYENEANPEAHARWTGPQILAQTAGELTVFCAGLGTTGTMVGAGGFLKKHVSHITNVGVVRKPNNPVPGVRTRNLLREIAFDWNGAADATVEAGTKEAFEESLRLCRRGVLVGPSSGFALAGLLAFLRGKKEGAELDALRNTQGEIVAVFICPDSPFPYIDEYFEFLDAKWFAEIENAYLLHDRDIRAKNDVPSDLGGGDDLAAADAFSVMYSVPLPEAWRLINAGESVPMRADVVVIDVRDGRSYEHAHLPNAERVDYADALHPSKDRLDGWRGKTVYVMCGLGNRSGVVASTLRDDGIAARSIDGGMLEWSRLNLPRWRPEICISL
jgi:cysteine synthase/rhodanese-related sulfurtransferase